MPLCSLFTLQLFCAQIVSYSLTSKERIERENIRCSIYPCFTDRDLLWLTCIISQVFSLFTCCCPSELIIESSPSFLQDKFQFPTTMTSSHCLVKRGKVVEFDVTADLARYNFSRNSPRFSLESEPPSGLPLEYIVASLPSNTNLSFLKKIKLKTFNKVTIWIPDTQIPYSSQWQKSCDMADHSNTGSLGP